MSEFRDKIQDMINEGIGRSPASLVGTIVAYDTYAGTVTVEALNPTSPGMIRFSDLPLPFLNRNMFSPGPIVGSQVSILFTGGNPQMPEIVAIKPPGKDNASEKVKLYRNYTYLPGTIKPL